jgi:hypothetical protein
MIAQVPPSGEAVAAAPADDVALTGDHVAHLNVVNVATERRHRPHELVPDDHGDRDRLLRPGIPIPDVHVGPTNGSLMDFDEYIVDPHLRLRDVLQPQSFFSIPFD